MAFDQPTFVVLDVPEPVAAQVREMRRRFDAMGDRFPIEITVAGSSGVGTIAADEDQAEVFRRLEGWHGWPPRSTLVSPA